MEDSEILRSRMKLKRVRIILICAVIAIVSFLLIQSFSSRVQAVDKQQKNVQLANELPESNMMKAIPEAYNGHVWKVAYLTFDDGPSAYQEEMLNILKRYDVRATFFLIGANIPSHKESLERLVEEGHYPGLHSMSHDYQKLYKEGQIVNEMKQVQELVLQATGMHIKLTRCPYGSMPGLTKELRDQMAAADLKEWDWTIDSLDWRLANDPNGIVQNVVSKATKNQEVILLHEKAQTVAALPAIIEGLKAKGYEFSVYDEGSHVPLNFWHDSRL